MLFVGIIIPSINIPNMTIYYIESCALISIICVVHTDNNGYHNKVLFLLSHVIYTNFLTKQY